MNHKMEYFQTLILQNNVPDKDPYSSLSFSEVHFPHGLHKFDINFRIINDNKIIPKNNAHSDTAFSKNSNSKI